MPAAPSALRLRACVIDLTARLAVFADREQPLSRLEVALLEHLAARPGVVVSRDELLVEVWGYPRPLPTRAVDNTVARLRTRIEVDPKAPDHLTSVRGVGYCFVPLPEDPQSTRRGSFHGRAPERAALELALESGARLVTLHGTGGSGKSRLAAEWAATTRTRSVTATPGVAALTGRIAVGLDIPLPAGLTGTASIERARHALRERPDSRLLIDQIDDALDAARAVLPMLLEGDSTLQVVCTSRVLLGLPEETAITVGPLPEPDALALLRARSDSVLPDDDLRPLVRRTDGLPLALELAAARLRRLGPEAPPAIEAPRPLADALAASWSRLTDTGQRALQAAAVFDSDVSLSDVLATGAVSRGDVAAAISGLVDAALLVPADVPGRFHLLDTTRRWVRAQAPPAAHWLERTAEHRLAQAEALAAGIPGPDGVALRRQLHRLGPELSRLAELVHHAPGGPRQAALVARLLLATGPAVLVEGPADLDQVERAMEAARGSDDPTLVARVHCLRGALRHLGGRPEAALDDYDAVLTTDPPRDLAVEAHFRRGWAQVALGRLEAGAADCRRALALASSPAPPLRALRAAANIRLGAILHLSGALSEARRALRAALDDAQHLGDAAVEARTLGNLALFDIERGRPGRARAGLQAALEHAEETHAALSAMQVRINLGGLAHRLGDLDDARHHLQVAHATAVRMGDRLCRSMAECGLGALALERDDPTEARRQLGRARVGFGAVSHPVYVAITWEWLALLEAADGDPEAAHEALAAAHAALPAPPDGIAQARACITAGVEAMVAGLPLGPLPDHDSSATHLARRVVEAVVAREG